MLWLAQAMMLLRSFTKSAWFSIIFLSNLTANLPRKQLWVASPHHHYLNFCLFQLPVNSFEASSPSEVESMANSSYSLDLPLRHYRCQVGDQVACRPNMATETIKCSEGETLVSLFNCLFISVTYWECLQLENTPTTWWPNLGSCLNQRYVSLFALFWQFCAVQFWSVGPCVLSS